MSLKLKKRETSRFCTAIQIQEKKKIKRKRFKITKTKDIGWLVTHLLNVSCVSALTDSDTPPVEACGPLKDICGKL